MDVSAFNSVTCISHSLSETIFLVTMCSTMVVIVVGLWMQCAPLHLWVDNALNSESYYINYMFPKVETKFEIW